MADLPLVAYANRLPVQKTRGGWRVSAGGLVTALRPALDSRGGAWVGWDGGASSMPERADDLDVDLAPVHLSRREVADFYHGFANRTLWPLLHGVVEQPVFERRWFETYRRVNDLFAGERVGRERRGALHWVQDYQLMLLPQALRDHGHRGPIGFFLHVPFPAVEVFARLPWRRQILDGLLGADRVSFHTDGYRRNFVEACTALCPDVAVEDAGAVLRLGDDGRRVATAANPISIDAVAMAERAAAGGADRCLRSLHRQFAGRRVLLGVDRLDYTKGILERLKAVELVLERRSDLRGQLAFVQIAVPSRGEIREYRELRAAVEHAVGRINGRFTEPGYDVPVHYLHRGVPFDRLLGYYRLADACLVTPLRDGMNLVAKEFVTAQAAADGAGALVLSEFTGAAAELGDQAVMCNPFDVDGLAERIEAALELPEGERRERIARMATTVAGHDVFSWVDQELEPLANVR
jgi:trehalose 6-phosphate synthase